jgi:2-octaprenyl-6-methoxyphenol hydroxylase
MPDRQALNHPSASSARSVVIAGAGAVGMSFALLLKQQGGAAIDVTLCDPTLDLQTATESRAYALAPSSIALFERLSLWPSLASHAQPVLAMDITDSALEDPVRQVLLSLQDDKDHEPVAFLLEGDILQRVLKAACDKAGVIFHPYQVSGFKVHPAFITVETTASKPLKGALLVAADGKRSTLREMAGIAWVGCDYPQTALTGTLFHERPHEGRAVQHFLPSGPFALLPLVDDAQGRHRSSLVWSEARDAASAFLALDEAALMSEIERRFGLSLGSLKLDKGLKSYPLSCGIARHFIGPRLALLGDAAHRIHPLAGQGLNLGLQDAKALSETLINALRLGFDCGLIHHLASYETARRPPVTAMLAATDGLNRLFSSENRPLRLARNAGLGWVQKSAHARRFFMQQAS